MPTCPVGHESPAYAQFCTTCGAPMQTDSAESTPLLASPVAAAPPSGSPSLSKGGGASQPPVPAAPSAPPPAATTPMPVAPSPGAPRAAASYAPPAGYGAPPAAPAYGGPPAAPAYGGPPAAPAYGGPPAAPAYGGPPAAPAYGGPPAAPAGHGSRYHFQMRRLTLIDQITAAAALILFIALWLNWFGTSSDGFSYDIGGINAHSYLSFVVLTSIILIAYLAARAGWDRLPVQLPIAHAPLLLVVGVVQLIIVLIAFLVTPNGLSHDAGSWIALIAALGASLPIAIPALQASQRR